MSVSKIAQTTNNDYEATDVDDDMVLVPASPMPYHPRYDKNTRYPTYAQLQEIRRARLAAVKAQQIAEGTYQPTVWDMLREKNRALRRLTTVKRDD